MHLISANGLKTTGVAAIELALADHGEAVISLRGIDQFLVIDLAHHPYLPECDLGAALPQARAEVVASLVVNEPANTHLALLDALL
jgi:hypothetical protein